MEFANRRKINIAEMARQLGISSTYAYLILQGKRKSKKYEAKIRDYVKTLSNAA